ncbi:MAG TPA: porin family protein [Porticoccus sp.]|nr:porin family protein [Porticoccus sp.]
MMMKASIKYSMLLLGLGVSFAGTTQAADYYASAAYGINDQFDLDDNLYDLDSDTGNYGSISFGKYFREVRVELEYSYTDADIDSNNASNDKGEVETKALFINGFHDFETNNKFKPYLGAGIGWMNVDVEYKQSGIELIDDDDNIFAFQAIAGVGYDITDSLNIFAQARYRNGEDSEVKSNLLPTKIDIEIESYIYDIGIKYSF